MTKSQSLLGEARRPITVKVFGVVSVTRTGYLRLQVLAVLAFVGMFFIARWWVATLERPDFAWIPWALLAGVAVEIIESVFVLRRFAEKERALAGECTGASPRDEGERRVEASPRAPEES